MMTKKDAQLAVTTSAFDALAAFAIAEPAAAQTATNNCADHENVVQRLAANYGETRKSIALSANNAVVEVFASTETGTWTLVVTTPGGPSCLIASGEAYQAVDDDLPVNDQGA